MHKLKKITLNWIKAFVYPRPLIGFLYLPRFLKYWIAYAKQSRIHNTTPVTLVDIQPCLGDWTSHTPFDAHYFYQGAWLARRLKTHSVTDHVDIASSALTISVLSAMVNTTFVDYRPLKAKLSGLNCIAGDVLNLPFETNSVPSLSCLHVIEHIGLGRYGDPINPKGSIEAALELERIVSPGGKFYLALPIGVERICFNAHRVHSPTTVVKMFPHLKLLEFSFVDDDGQFQEHQQLQAAAHLDYGCGLYLFEKL